MLGTLGRFLPLALLCIGDDEGQFDMPEGAAGPGRQQGGEGLSTVVGGGVLRSMGDLLLRALCTMKHSGANERAQQGLFMLCQRCGRACLGRVLPWSACPRCRCAQLPAACGPALAAGSGADAS